MLPNILVTGKLIDMEKGIWKIEEVINRTFVLIPLRQALRASASPVSAKRLPTNANTTTSKYLRSRNGRISSRATTMNTIAQCWTRMR